MAFRYVEQIQSGVPPPEGPQFADQAYDNLKAAVEVLKEFRAMREPIFVLRGHDRMAPRAIVAWGQFVSSASATGLAAEHASHGNDKFVTWQEAHPEMVKMPD